MIFQRTPPTLLRKPRLPRKRATTRKNALYCRYMESTATPTIIYTPGTNYSYLAAIIFELFLLTIINIFQGVLAFFHRHATVACPNCGRSDGPTEGMTNRIQRSCCRIHATQPYFDEFGVTQLLDAFGVTRRLNITRQSENVGGRTRRKTGNTETPRTQPTNKENDAHTTLAK